MTATGTAVAAKATVAALEEAREEAYMAYKTAAAEESASYDRYREARRKAERLNDEVDSLDSTINIMKERSKA